MRILICEKRSSKTDVFLAPNLAHLRFRKGRVLAAQMGFEYAYGKADSSIVQRLIDSK